MHCENFSAEPSPLPAALALAVGTPGLAVATVGSLLRPQPAAPTASSRANAGTIHTGRCFFVLVDMRYVPRFDRSHAGHRKRLPGRKKHSDREAAPRPGPPGQAPR